MFQICMYMTICAICMYVPICQMHVSIWQMTFIYVTYVYLHAFMYVRDNTDVCPILPLSVYDLEHYLHFDHYLHFSYLNHAR